MSKDIWNREEYEVHLARKMERALERKRKLEEKKGDRR